MTVPRLHKLPQNNQDLNQAALRWLREAKESPEEDSPFVLQLLWVGFDRGLPIPGLGQGYRWELKEAFERLLGPRFDQVKVLKWLLANPEAGAPRRSKRPLRWHSRERRLGRGRPSTFWRHSATG